jgi:hypothetical protein
LHFANIFLTKNKKMRKFRIEQENGIVTGYCSFLSIPNVFCKT